MAFLVVNTGVLAASTVLADTAIAAGVGLGLFGVLAGLSPHAGLDQLSLMAMIVTRSGRTRRR